MSKIHEALRKAQQERNTKLAPGTAVVTPEAPMGDAGIFDDFVARTFAPASEAAEEAFRLEHLQECCSKPAWKLDQRTTVFSNGAKRKLGAEQFRNLRSRLYHLRETRPIRSLMVTSALPGEGKTFVASNLAQAIALQPGRQVLLIDGDLRAPKLHARLGAPATPGLADFLLGHANLNEVVQYSSKENIYFIPGGNLVPDPTELILNGTMKGLISRVTGAFDWVIVDSPPTLPVSDAASLADLCDGVLFVVRAGSTSFDSAQRASNEFRERNLIGVVLNRAEAQFDNYGYYPDGDGPKNNGDAPISRQK